MREKFIEAARERYALGSSDNIEIDDDAKLSETDDGAWVQAWVWVPNAAAGVNNKPMSAEIDTFALEHSND